MLNWLMRYAPVLRALRQTGTTDVLEVGSGAWGLAEFVDFAVTGCDVAFEAGGSARLRPVVGSILHLPFADGQFECVVCLDTLEHLAPEQREPAIDELIRVAGTYLVVGCPMDGAAHAMDRKLYDRYLARAGQAPPWLEEHMEHPFPRREDVARQLAARGLRFRVCPSENVWFHYLIMRAEMTRGLSSVLSVVSRRRLARRWMPALGFGRPYRTLFFARKAPHG